MVFDQLEKRFESLPEKVKGALCLGNIDDWNARTDQRRWLFDQAAYAPGGPALEIGTGYGLSSVIISAARLDKNSILTSVDISSERITFASLLCHHFGVKVEFVLGDTLDVLKKLNPIFSFVLVDGLHSYKHEKAGVDFGKRCEGAKIIIDDVRELSHDAYRINCRNMIGRQLARWPKLFHLLGNYFNDGGTPKLFKEFGSPPPFFDRYMVIEK